MPKPPIAFPESDIIKASRIMGLGVRAIELLGQVRDICKDNFRDAFSHTSGHYTVQECLFCGSSGECSPDCPMNDIAELLTEVDGTGELKSILDERKSARLSQPEKQEGPGEGKP